MLVSTATGGVLQRIVQRTPGPETWTTTMAISAGTSTLSSTGFLFVASGINLFDYLTI